MAEELVLATETRALLPDDAVKSPTTRVYCSRWHMLVMFSFLSFNNAFIWISFAPVTANTGWLGLWCRPTVNPTPCE